MTSRLIALTLWLAAVAITIDSFRAPHADALASHIAGDQLRRIFAAQVPADFKPTGITRPDYLKLIAADVDFFKNCQNADGAIIDPVSKGERQYSTPAFALAAAVVVKQAGRSDLLDPAARAMSCALSALVNHSAADNHADFYIPMLVHANRLLKDLVPASQAAEWAQQFQSIIPEKLYRADLRGMNWNIVSCSGELLRRRDGLVAADQLDPQINYLDRCLAGHMDTFTTLGLVQDPGAPLAYDAFSRLWLEDVFADDAYTGYQADRIRAFLRVGGLSSLLLLSPTGEWANGGRSGMHNWTDAENVVICEINANYWKQQRRNDIAGAFKRAAHLAFESVARWQRPGGDLWIIKNRAEPQSRLAFETYSNHSQYNLLPMAMLAIAYTRADDTIAERPSVSETGGYVFDARQTFHKIAAAAAGYYVLLDTAADAHYNATGLQRVHKAGVLFPTLSDSSAASRVFGPADSPRLALTPAIQWKSAAADSPWIGLSDFQQGAENLKILSADLQVDEASGEKTSFSVIYKLAGAGQDGRFVTERYTLTADGVNCQSAVTGGSPVAAWRVHFPILVSDGAADLPVTVTPDQITTRDHDSMTSLRLTSADLASGFSLVGPRIVSHAGYVQEAVAGIRSGSTAWQISLSEQQQNINQDPGTK
jgi:hypothetical protein